MIDGLIYEFSNHFFVKLLVLPVSWSYYDQSKYPNKWKIQYIFKCKSTNNINKFTKNIKLKSDNKLPKNGLPQKAIIISQGICLAPQTLAVFKVEKDGVHPGQDKIDALKADEWHHSGVLAKDQLLTKRVLWSV